MTLVARYKAHERGLGLICIQSKGSVTIDTEEKGEWLSIHGNEKLCQEGWTCMQTLSLGLVYFSALCLSLLGVENTGEPLLFAKMHPR